MRFSTRSADHEAAESRQYWLKESVKSICCRDSDGGGDAGEKGATVVR